MASADVNLIELKGRGHNLALNLYDEVHYIGAFFNEYSLVKKCDDIKFRKIISYDSEPKTRTSLYLDISILNRSSL